MKSKREKQNGLQYIPLHPLKMPKGSKSHCTQTEKRITVKQSERKLNTARLMSLILSNIFKSERRQFFLHNVLPKLYFIDLFVTCLHVDELVSRRHAGKL